MQKSSAIYRGHLVCLPLSFNSSLCLSLNSSLCLSLNSSLCLSLNSSLCLSLSASLSRVLYRGHFSDVANLILRRKTITSPQRLLMGLIDDSPVCRHIRRR